ncbi:DUF541 domain-containing protein [Pontibacter qinzhouensis]|uniref:DUF541 domain-containing protein n=1 Tax=Pontibacter qinzhouensis TaxID=2603253 RepID=A0A5C8K6R8_9BACT|nr:SIMPL domain-containing protein [Pontibacter qinzhouensis]TXK47550.1 DUF541 domain-containing protein [Pontibacter qinzhouensis]
MKKSKLMLLMLFALAAPMVLQAQTQQILPPMINVDGRGEVKVQPNEVVVTLGVELRDKNLDQVRKQADTKAAAIIAYLKKQGVDAKNIQTSYMHVQPVYNTASSEFGKTTPDFYMAQKTMTFVLTKLDKFDEVISGLYGVGVNRVDGIAFRVSDVEKYKVEARKKAVNDAKAKAAALTNDLGAKVGKVYAISESTNGGGPQPLYARNNMMVQQAAMMDGDPSIAGGEVVITSTVSVSFVLEQ